MPNGLMRWSARETSVEQIERMVRIARELATGREARAIYRIGAQYKSADETLAKLGLPPNRDRGQRGVPMRHAA